METLHKTPTGYVLVSGIHLRAEEIDDAAITGRKLYVDDMLHAQYIIASIPHIEGLPVMQLNDCLAIERGFDVEKLAKDYCKSKNDSFTAPWPYKDGFNKSLELTKEKKFTVADMEKAIEMARCKQIEGGDDVFYEGDYTYTSNKIINSLTPSQWEVSCDIENNQVTNLKRV